MRGSAIFLLFYVFLHHTHAAPKAVARCAAQGLASVATPPTLSELAGDWYVYATTMASWKQHLNCMVCRIKPTSELQCIFLRNRVWGGATFSKYEYVTARVSYSPGTKIFSVVGFGSNPVQTEFWVTKFNKQRSSMVLGLCDEQFVDFTNKHFKVELGLGMGGDLSTLTEMTGAKTDVDYKTKCFGVAFDFFKPQGIVTTSTIITGPPRNVEIFKNKNYNDPCVVSPQCIQTNQECKNKKCACIDGTAYNAALGCVKVVAYDGICTNNAECVKGANQICAAAGASKKCKCKPSHIRHAAEGCLPERARTQTCKINEQCTGAQQECKTPSGGGAKQCDCKTNAVLIGVACKLKANFDGACEDNGQCILGANLHCTGSVGSKKCKCKPSYVRHNVQGCLQEKALGVACAVNEQCNGGSQECKVPAGGGPKKCACVSNAVLVGGTSCKLKANFDGACEDNAQCILGANLHCTGSAGSKKCKCKPTYVRHNVQGCVQEKAYGAACVVNEQCNGGSQECKNRVAGGPKKCACIAAAVLVGGSSCKLKATYDGACEDNAQCILQTNLQCTGSAGSKKCKCKAGWVRDNVNGCVQKKALTQGCTVNVQCFNDHQECKSPRLGQPKVCSCLSTAVVVGGSNCKLKAIYDAACVDPAQCVLGNHQTCTLNKCACANGYIRDTVACIKKKAHGEGCTKNLECTGAEQECRVKSPPAKTCQCKTTHVYDKVSACKLKRKYTESCDVSAQCVGAGQECKSKRCVCLSNHRHDVAGGCVEVKTFGQACTYSTQCTGNLQECNSGTNKCACNGGAVVNPTTSNTCLPKVDYGGVCTNTAQCVNGKLQVCAVKGATKTCQCAKYPTPHVHGGGGTCYKVVNKKGGACKVDVQCTQADPIRECKSGACECQSSAVWHAASSKCLPKLVHGAACKITAQCAQLNQECSGGGVKLCACKSGYVHASGSGCLKKVTANGGACTESVQCTIAGQQCIGTAGRKKCLCFLKVHKSGNCVNVPKEYERLRADSRIWLRRVPISDTYANAVTGCNGHLSGKAKLVSIKSSELNQKVFEMIRGKEAAWIGLKQHSSGTRYTYADGASFLLSDPAYQNWFNDGSKDFTGTPKDGSDCIYMYQDTGKWEDNPCACKHEYICEINDEP